jgi:hypothetical protein
MTPEETWRVSRTFLDQQIISGKTIIHSHDPAKAIGYYLREVQYLDDIGYRFIQYGWVWRAVK